MIEVLIYQIDEAFRDSLAIISDAKIAPGVRKSQLKKFATMSVTNDEVPYIVFKKEAAYILYPIVQTYYYKFMAETEWYHLKYYYEVKSLFASYMKNLESIYATFDSIDVEISVELIQPLLALKHRLNIHS